MVVHWVAYSIKQSRTISPILSVCVGEIMKAQQDKILNSIRMLLAWNGRSLCWGRERREKKGAPLGQVKIPEKAWSLVVFIMNSYGPSFFGLLPCAVETINCLSLRFWLNPRVSEWDWLFMALSVQISLLFLFPPMLHLKQGWRAKYFLQSGFFCPVVKLYCLT